MTKNVKTDYKVGDKVQLAKDIGYPRLKAGTTGVIDRVLTYDVKATFYGDYKSRTYANEEIEPASLPGGFKVGDKVLAVDDVWGWITKGQTYEVLGSRFAKEIDVLADNGRNTSFYATHFKKLEDILQEPPKQAPQVVTYQNVWSALMLLIETMDKVDLKTLDTKATLSAMQGLEALVGTTKG